MPLVSGKAAKTQAGISENIRREKHAHPDMDVKQAAAIAYSQAKETKKEGRTPAGKQKKTHKETLKGILNNKKP